MKKIVMLDTEHPRSFLLEMLLEKGLTLKSLSLKLGKNQAYLHQYIYRQSPKILPEAIRFNLSRLLDINERFLRPEHTEALPSNKNVSIPYLDHPSQRHYSDGPWFLPETFFQGRITSTSDDIKLVVIGDNTATLNIKSGDVVMLDTADKTPLRAGYFGIDMGDHIRVRHLEQVSIVDQRVMVSNADSTAYEMLAYVVAIHGRVIFHAQLFNLPPTLTP